MGYSKGGLSAPGPFMNSGKGMGSSKDNPMKAAREVAPMCGPGMNADQKHANKLLQKAHKEKDSLRGMSGM